MSSIDIAISFDTTGSMYPCLTQVRRKIQDLSTQLFRDIDDLRIAVVAHGDYEDGDRVLSTLDFTDDPKAVCRFVSNVKPTSGGDYAECYELVLKHARSLSWRASKSRALVMVGDAVPHAPGYRHLGKTYMLDWQDELQLLTHDFNVNMYAVQCLRTRRNTEANRFWEALADKGNGYHLELDQFATMPELLRAIGLQQLGDDQLRAYERQLADDGRLTRNVDDLFGRLLRRPAQASRRAPDRFRKRADSAEVDPSRFQVLRVDTDATIRDFVEDNGLLFQPGRGFYEFTKTVTVQERKEVVIRDNRTGDLFSGDRARAMINLPFGRRGSVNPRRIAGLDDHTVFIQSTSWNRKLLGGTQFLYEVDSTR